MKYPLTLNIENFGTYYLNGVIKKTIENGEKFFICIYREINNWFISDGFKIEQYTSTLNHNIGNVVMLFYSNEN